MENKEASKYFSVEQERHFKPHKDLLGTAHFALENVDSKCPCGRDRYFILTAIVMSAFAQEAIANTFGKELIKDWKDFEKRRLLDKLRIIAEKLDIRFSRSEKPWVNAIWLGKLRNSIAHGKPKEINFVKKKVPKKQANGFFGTPPPSEIEKQLSLGNAKRAFETAEGILDLFMEKIPRDKHHDFIGDGWTTATTILSKD